MADERVFPATSGTAFVLREILYRCLITTETTVTTESLHHPGSNGLSLRAGSVFFYLQKNGIADCIDLFPRETPR